MNYPKALQSVYFVQLLVPSWILPLNARRIQVPNATLYTTPSSSTDYLIMMPSCFMRRKIWPKKKVEISVPLFSISNVVLWLAEDIGVWTFWLVDFWTTAWAQSAIIVSSTHLPIVLLSTVLRFCAIASDINYLLTLELEGGRWIELRKRMLLHI